MSPVRLYVSVAAEPAACQKSYGETMEPSQPSTRTAAEITTNPTKRVLYVPHGSAWDKVHTDERKLPSTQLGTIRNRAIGNSLRQLLKNSFPLLRYITPNCT